MIFFQTMADIFGALYFLFDHPMYFHKIGLVTFPPELATRISWWSEFWWLLQSICEVMCHVVAIQDMQVNLQSLKQKKEQVKLVANDSKLMEINQEISTLDKQYKAKCRGLLRVFSDCPTALCNMNMIVGQQVGGVTGTVASFVSLYEIWGTK